jgi:hypothetical protein
MISPATLCNHEKNINVLFEINFFKPLISMPFKVPLRLNLIMQLYLDDFD